MRWSLAYGKVLPACDHVVCLGDIVNGGGEADACINFIREKQIPTVRGNHDEAWLAMCGWTDLASDNFKYMRELPVWLDHNGVVLVHDDPVVACDDPDAWRSSQGYLLHQYQAENVFASAAIFRCEPRIAAIGHTHVPSIFTTQGQLALKPTEPISLPPGQSCILNPGAVGGRPRSSWGNSYGILDLNANTFTVHQLDLPKLADPWDDIFDKILSY